MEGIERRFTFHQEVPQIWFEFVLCKTPQITALVNLTINMSCMACPGTDKFLWGLNDSEPVLRKPMESVFVQTELRPDQRCLL